MSKDRSLWKSRARVMLLTVFLSALCTGAVAAEASSELLAAARGAVDTLTDLRARFTQTSHLAASGLETGSGGTVELARGGQMRWSYEGDDPQEIVCDGITLWFYQVRDRTVLRRELGGLPPASRLALDLLGGFEGVEEHFALGGCGESCLELTPREPQPDLSRVQVRLAPNRLVASVTTEDALGNRTRVAFSDVATDPGLPAERFQFVVPEGVEVLDMESGQ